MNAFDIFFESNQEEPEQKIEYITPQKRCHGTQTNSFT